MSDRVSGTEGYAEEAEALLKQYESIRFAQAHRHVLHLIPTAPCKVLDVGAGTGRDAAGLAELGHHVVAVEPTAALRIRAMELHPSPLIEWVDDCLPDLDLICARGEIFDVAILSAVWMHLDLAQRRRAMPRVASLVTPGGLVILTLRHGPVPAGRRMFEVSGEETIQLGKPDRLVPVLTLERQDSTFGLPGVSWTHLAFVKRD
ncbi:MAG TPA: class I SAM-dependent methyltransferase [Stellaceae bacterium]|jgi:SAM-dependent methyltransferase|nr:class I SAM-dependent methyltransferase [Stellaceae bacterium]